MQTRAQNVRKDYSGRIICILTHASAADALPDMLQCCLQPVSNCSIINRSINLEQNLYKNIELLCAAEHKNEQNIAIFQFPLDLAEHLVWILPDIVILANIDHDKQSFHAKVFGEVMQIYQKTFEALKKVRAKKTVQLIVSHDVHQYDAIQLVAVGAGFSVLHSFGTSPQAKLRLISQQLTKTGQNIIIRYDKTIKMYQLPVIDFNSTQCVLACLSVLYILQFEHQTYIKKIPLHAYYALQRKQGMLTNKTIGFLCQRVPGKSLENTLTANYLGRIAMVSQCLQSQGLRFFIYSPIDVNFEKNLAHGHFYHEKRLVPDVIPIPKINANWISKALIAFGKKFTRQEFSDLLKKQGCDVYPKLKVPRLMGDKYKTYRLVQLFDDKLQPHTEVYLHKQAQLERLLSYSGLAFLKQVAGHAGENMVTIKKQKTGYIIKHYFKKDKVVTSHTSIQSLLKAIKAIVQDKRHIIQQGILSAQYNQSVFDVRVLMVNDGKHWHWRNKKRCAPPQSELSNFTQGGQVDDDDKVLQACFGKPAANKIMRDLYATSYRLVRFLQCFYRDDIAEINFDYVVDHHKRFYFLETHAKAGLFIRRKKTDPFDFTPTPEAHLNSYVMPHLTALTQFFSQHWHDYNNEHPRLALANIKQSIKMDVVEEKNLYHKIWQHICFKKHLQQWRDPLLQTDKVSRFVILSVGYGHKQESYSNAAGFGLQKALNKAIDRLYVRYLPKSQLKTLKVELVDGIVYARTVDLLRKLPNYQTELGIAFESDAGLCFTSEQVQQYRLVDEDKKFDFVAAAKMLHYHPWLREALLSLKLHPIQKIIYFKTRTFEQRLNENE